MRKSRRKSRKVKSDIREILSDCDIPEEKIDMLDTIYAEELGPKRIPIGNIVSRNGISIKTKDGVVIRSETINGADITEAVSDDGRPVLVVHLNDGDIDVNGLEVHIV